MFRVSVVRVFLGCKDLDPPYQRPDADSKLKLGGCLSWPLIWPKALIRAENITTSGLAPSLGKVIPPPILPAIVVADDPHPHQPDPIADLEEEAHRDQPDHRISRRELHA
jgi:hypothetical protein